MFTDAALFSGLWFRKPLQIAAITLSSTRLATVMTGLVDLCRPGLVLARRAGTGSLPPLHIRDCFAVGE